MPLPQQPCQALLCCAALSGARGPAPTHAPLPKPLQRLSEAYSRGTVEVPVQQVRLLSSSSCWVSGNFHLKCRWESQCSSLHVRPHGPRPRVDRIPLAPRLRAKQTRPRHATSVACGSSLAPQTGGLTDQGKQKPTSRSTSSTRGHFSTSRSKLPLESGSYIARSGTQPIASLRRSSCSVPLARSVRLIGRSAGQALKLERLQQRHTE